MTAYAEYPNGATGVFITTTGECPGTNRLEISGDKGKLVWEDGKLTHWALETPEREFCFTCQEGFAQPKMTVTEIETGERRARAQRHPAKLHERDPARRRAARAGL